MAKSEFATDIIQTLPETQRIVDEHIQFYEELLLHVLVADLLRYAIALFEGGDTENLHCLLAVMDRAMREGDPDVENAVAVSFVENTGWWDCATQPFIATWPAALRSGVERQRRA